jgi:hypothetical protein
VAFRIERRLDRATAAQSVRKFVARIANAAAADRVPVIAAFDRQEPAVGGVKHRCLQGDVDGLAAAGGTETLLQTAGCDLDKHLGQFQARCMEVAGIHVKRSVVASECLDDFWPAPAEIADAPSGEEMDIAAALATE